MGEASTSACLLLATTLTSDGLYWLPTSQVLAPYFKMMQL